MKISLVMLSLFIASIAQAQDDFFEPGSSIGGYGEMHYNVDYTNDTRVLDFHRFIIFYGYQFTPHWSFNSEVELEHNLVSGGEGELELEQAFIDYHPSAKFGVRFGVVLAPAGIINLIHEPPTFLSVERPDYANSMIPTTWFGNGLVVYGAFNQFEYNVTIMEGLNGDMFSPSTGIRSGRQKGYQANAKELLYAGRIDYTGLPDTRIGLSYTLNKAVRAGQDPIGLNLFEVHAKYYANNIYGVFELGNISYSDYEVESSFGYYLDLGYNIGDLLGLSGELIPWFQWSDLNPASATTLGGPTEETFHNQKWMLGLTFKPVDQISFKLDYAARTRELGGSITRLFNFGVGYMF